MITESEFVAIILKKVDNARHVVKNGCLLPAEQSLDALREVIIKRKAELKDLEQEIAIGG